MKNENTSKLICQLVDSYAGGSKAEFGRLINKPKSWVGDKIAGRHGISFDNFIDICKGLNIESINVVTFKSN